MELKLAKVRFNFFQNLKFINYYFYNKIVITNVKNVKFKQKIVQNVLIKLDIYQITVFVLLDI